MFDFDSAASKGEHKPNKDVSKDLSLNMDEEKLGGGGETASERNAFDEFTTKHKAALAEWRRKAKEDAKKLPTRAKQSKLLNLFYIRDNLKFFWLIVALLIVYIELGIYQYISYMNTANSYLIVAKICGILIDFSICLLVVLMARNLINFLRSLKYVRFLIDFDRFTLLHKLIGAFTVLAAFVHSLMHWLNLSTLYNNNNNNNNNITIQLNSTTYNNKNNSSNLLIETSDSSLYFEYLFGTKSQLGWINNSAVPTGWALIFLLVLVFVFSLPIIRRKYFHLFYLSHWLVVPLFLLLIVHARTFWKWFVLPGTIFVVECLIRLVRAKSAAYGRTRIKQVNILPSKTINLVIERPERFNFVCGDYLFIKIADVSRYEWHPFTISSSPDKRDELCLHIRALGDWTNKLHDYFFDYYLYSRMRKNVTSAVETSENDDNEEDAKKLERIFKSLSFQINVTNRIDNVALKCQLDGPYGTCSRQIFSCEHPILVASGIGVTPFSSILQHFWHNYSHDDDDDDDSRDKIKCKTVDFIWTNSDYESFEWLLQIFAELKVRQLHDARLSASNRTFIDFHLYMTRASHASTLSAEDIFSNDYDFKNLTIKPNLMKNFELRLECGRPNFAELFANINAKKTKNKHVFFCGNRKMADTIQKHCFKFDFAFSKETF
jgi:NADPH oxidase 5